MVLNLKNISFSYNRVPFIRELSISLELGSFVGLIGSNGSGKSTILKLASGILKPETGNITLWGKPIHKYREKDRAKLISFLPQMLDFNFPFKVSELVSMGQYPYDIPPQLSLEEALQMVGLLEKMDSYIYQLSGGEKRRAFIGMTLLQGAGLILLDEPFANLDIKYQIELIRLLRRLRDDANISIFMALHDINMAFQFDKLYIIKEGRVMKSGEPNEIVTEKMLRDVFDVNVNIYHQEDGTVSLGYA